jgi:hypothetical protein
MRSYVNTSVARYVLWSMRNFVVLTVAAVTMHPTLGFAQRDDGPVTLKFFGLHRKFDDPWPSVPFGSWRATLAWKNAEPERGVWDFRKTDQQVEQAAQHGVDLVFDIGYIPTWASSTPGKRCMVGMGSCAEPRSMDEWRNWISVVGNRYKGKVKYYEIWNEPNDSVAFYTGSIRGLVEMTKAAREVFESIDPDIRILSPSPTSPVAGPRVLEQFLAAGGGKYCDIISYHFYVHPGPPEGVYRYAERIWGLMRRYDVSDKPLWDSEIGWGAPELDDTTQAAYIARTMLLQRAAGISRVFWYMWAPNDQKKLRFIEADRQTPGIAGQALQRTEDWMLGAVVSSCDSSDKPEPAAASHGVWTCVLQRGEEKSYVVWNPDGDKRWGIPGPWQVTKAHDILGRAASLTSDRQITIHSYPVLLNNAQ